MIFFYSYSFQHENNDEYQGSKMIIKTLNSKFESRKSKQFRNPKFE